MTDMYEQAEWVAGKAAAEVCKLDAEQAQTDRENVLKQLDELELEAKQRHFDWARASDLDHRVHWLTGYIGYDRKIQENSVLDACEFLGRSARLDMDLPVQIMINSHGGDAFQGMALVDQMLALREQGLQIICTVRGVAASMAAIILQAATVREMGPSSSLLVHKPSVELAGSLDQIEDARNWLDIYQERQVDLFAERSSLSRTEIKRGMSRKDWTFSPTRALEAGFIDRIG
jgi:ATP-dependent protease ClpP protease subunit